MVDEIDTAYGISMVVRYGRSWGCCFALRMANL